MQPLPGFPNPGKNESAGAVEGLNATNTPHFANPSTNVSNLQLNPDGTVKNLNGFGVITASTRTGRQYDEREMRMGLRLVF